MSPFCEPRLAVQVGPLRRQIGEAAHVVMGVGLAALVLPPGACHEGHGSDQPASTTLVTARPAGESTLRRVLNTFMIVA